MHTAKCFFAECQKRALGKDAFCRVPKKHSAKCLFAECQEKALGKDVVCWVPKNGTRQNTSLPSAEKKHSAKPSLPSAEKNTRQSRLCRVLDKIHSAKLPAAVSLWLKLPWVMELIQLSPTSLQICEPKLATRVRSLGCQVSRSEIGWTCVSTTSLDERLNGNADCSSLRNETT